MFYGIYEYIYLLLERSLIFLMANERKIIDGALFEKMILGGVANLQKNAQKVNDLNVFPIPDGDTGENMYLTLQSGLNELLREKSENIGFITEHADCCRNTIFRISQHGRQNSPFQFNTGGLCLILQNRRLYVDRRHLVVALSRHD